MNDKSKVAVRDLTVKDKFSFARFLVQWEMILIYILIAINVYLMVMRPGLYFAPGTIQSIIQSGMDLSPLVLGMIFVLMLGDIDVSVASIMILAAMATGLSMDAGIPVVPAVLLGIIVGALCGAFNGILVAYCSMPAVIVTISTQMLFRGIVQVILDVNVLSNFPTFYNALAWTNIAYVPISLLVFLALGVVFIIVLHKSAFGRKLYMIGNNPVATQYSGINVKAVKLQVFVIMGMMAGIASIFFVGRMGGGVSSTMGIGLELNAIAICVLGGISTNGGRGKAYGPIISTLIMAFLIYTLGLLNVEANSRVIMTGFILIIAVLIRNLNKEILAEIKLRLLYQSNKNIEALNNKTAENIGNLKVLIGETKKDGKLSTTDKAEKIKKYESQIVGLKEKCKQQTKAMKQQQK
ncbi:MAG: ABC transporter permease [Lachnospiraceae bacterium]|nr:ABC transporter permease [Lachnospiraceae bacterium]